MDRASWLRLITIISFLANIKLKTFQIVVLVITSLRDPVAYAESSQPGAPGPESKSISEKLLPAARDEAVYSWERGGPANCTSRFENGCSG
jgi:hypothetical protein